MLPVNSKSLATQTIYDLNCFIVNCVTSNKTSQTCYVLIDGRSSKSWWNLVIIEILKSAQNPGKTSMINGKKTIKFNVKKPEI